MVFGLFRRVPPPAAPLYEAIVAQSRRAEFYRDCNVPDTPDGRFDMIVLHLCLVFRRLSGGGEDLRRLAQGVFDMFCADMDANLREMGVGDLAVPKRMRGVAEAFYGRLAAYGGALERADASALAAALARNVLGSDTVGAPAHALAVYARAVVRALDNEQSAAFSAGRLSFPSPGVPAAEGIGS
jgi:cytochrome b pre-mRNA-processing protein 3